MFSGGIRHPVRDFRIALAITLAAWGSIAWGTLEMRTAGWADELGSGLKIGLALLPAIIRPFLVLNLRWAVRLVAARRRGEGVFARWHVTAQALAAFIPEDARATATGPSTSTTGRRRARRRRAASTSSSALTASSRTAAIFRW